jgi:hypothetical protein
MYGPIMYSLIIRVYFLWTRIIGSCIISLDKSGFQLLPRTRTKFAQGDNAQPNNVQPVNPSPLFVDADYWVVHYQGGQK